MSVDDDNLTNDDLIGAHEDASGGRGLQPPSTGLTAAAGEADRAAPTTATTPRGPLRYLELDWRTVITVLLVFSAVALVMSTVRSLSSIMTSMVVAVFLALAINPLVGFYQRKLHLTRGLAVGSVLITITVVIAGIMLLFGPKTVEAGENLQNQLPSTLQQMTSLPIIGDTLAKNDVPTKAQQWLADLPKQLGSNDGAVASFLGAVSQGVGYFILTCLFTVVLVLDGPLLARRAHQLIPEENQRRATHLGAIVYNVIARYFAGSIVLGVLFGVWVLITGLILNVPLTPLLAVWAAITALLPQIGGALGGVVIVAVALTAPNGIVTALIMGGLYVAYMTFSNNVLLPVLVGRAINVSPPTTMLAAIGGFAVAGIIGALFAMPIVGSIKAVYLDIRADETDVEEKRKQGKEKRQRGLVGMVKRRRAERTAARAAAAAPPA